MAVESRVAFSLLAGVVCAAAAAIVNLGLLGGWSGGSGHLYLLIALAAGLVMSLVVLLARPRSWISGVVWLGVALVVGLGLVKYVGWEIVGRVNGGTD